MNARLEELRAKHKKAASEMTPAEIEEFLQELRRERVQTKTRITIDKRTGAPKGRGTRTTSTTTTKKEKLTKEKMKELLL